MRDPERIDRVLAALREAWLAEPDWRLGQLLVNVLRDGQGRVVEEAWNVEDDRWVELLTVMFEPPDFFERIGYVPNERQKRFHDGDGPTSIGGGSGSGKTTALSMEAAWWCDAEPGLQAVVLCANYPAAARAYGAASQFLRRVPSIRAVNSALTYGFGNGSLLTFIGSHAEPARTRGLLIQLLAVDDEPPVELGMVTSLRDRLRDNKGVSVVGEVWGV